MESILSVNKFELFKLLYIFLKSMILFLLFCIFQIAQSSLIFREITSGKCSDYNNWADVMNAKQCQTIHYFTHFYKESDLMQSILRLALSREMASKDCDVYIDWFSGEDRFDGGSLLTKLSNIYTQRTSNWLRMKEMSDDRYPMGCILNTYDPTGHDMFFNTNPHGPHCSVFNPCTCVYNPPRGSYVPHFFSGVCEKKLSAPYRARMPLRFNFNFNWPYLYDDTRYYESPDVPSSPKKSLFAQRRFQQDDMTNVWDTENDYIYDDLNSPIPLTYCKPGSIVHDINFVTMTYPIHETNLDWFDLYPVALDFFADLTETSCVACPEGKYHDGDFTTTTTCITCPSGYYSDREGSERCLSCSTPNHIIIKDSNGFNINCKSCLSQGQIMNQQDCQDCPTGAKTLDGLNCVPDPSYCAVGNVATIVSETVICNPLKTHSSLIYPTGLPTVTQTIAKFLLNIPTMKGYVDITHTPSTILEDISKLTRKLMLELVCDNMHIDQNRLAEKSTASAAALLPTLHVYNSYDICEGPTRHLRSINNVDACNIEFYNEILDSFRFDVLYRLDETKRDIYDALKAALGIEVDSNECAISNQNIQIEDCSLTRVTNCVCGASTCKSNNYEICRESECVKQSVLQFGTGVSLTQTECEQAYNVYAQDYVHAEFITGNLQETQNGSVITYSDGSEITFDTAANITNICYLSRGDIIYGPNMTGLALQYNTFERNPLGSDQTLYKPPYVQCPHNELSDECWCQNTDYCKNNYCIYGKCKTVPLCEYELGEARESQDCTCNDATCSQSQLCINGNCLDHLLCPDFEGYQNISDKCLCGSSVCDPGQGCQDGNCLAAPLCPNTNGFQQIVSGCSCGSNLCQDGQYCNNGTCLDTSLCVGYDDKTILEPEQCRCGGQVCSKNQICYEGNCLLATELACKTDGIHSYNVPCKCGQQTCGASQFCYFDTCFNDPVCPFEAPFNGLCHNGVHSSYATECERNSTFNYCSNRKFKSKAECETDNIWGYCSNSSFTDEVGCVSGAKNWTNGCTNPLLITASECRQKNQWFDACTIEGIESPAQCNSLTTLRSETCSCDLFSNNVAQCGLGQICEDNRCEDILCEPDHFNLLQSHCKCGNTMCAKGLVCFEDGICRAQPLCGFHQHNSNPKENINCLCEIGVNCDSTDINQPCTKNSCNRQLNESQINNSSRL